MTALAVTLPTGATNAVTLADDGTPANALSRLSGATIPTVDFANPTGGVTILRGQSGRYDRRVVARRCGFRRGLDVGRANAGFQAVTVNGAIAPGTNNSLGIFTSSFTANASAAVTLTGAGAFNLAADAAAINAAATITVAGARPSRRHGRSVDRNRTADGIGILGLTDAELDRVSAASLTLGAANSGALSSSSAICRARRPQRRLG